MIKNRPATPNFHCIHVIVGIFNHIFERFYVLKKEEICSKAACVAIREQTNDMSEVHIIKCTHLLAIALWISLCIIWLPGFVVLMVSSVGKKIGEERGDNNESDRSMVVVTAEESTDTINSTKPLFPRACRPNNQTRQDGHVLQCLLALHRFFSKSPPRRSPCSPPGMFEPGHTLGVDMYEVPASLFCRLVQVGGFGVRV